MSSSSSYFSATSSFTSYDLPSSSPSSSSSGPHSSTVSLYDSSSSSPSYDGVDGHIRDGHTSSSGTAAAQGSTMPVLSAAAKLAATRSAKLKQARLLENNSNAQKQVRYYHPFLITSFHGISFHIISFHFKWRWRL